MKVVLLNELAKLPTRKHETDAGLDLYANERVQILPGEFRIVKTGISIELPKNTFGWITNKSRNNFLIGGGIVDEGYTGELLVKVFNPTQLPVSIVLNQAFAQLLVIPIVKPEVTESVSVTLKTEYLEESLSKLIL